VKSFSLYSLAILLGGASHGALAVDAPASAPFDDITMYGAQGVNHNLLQLPGKILTGNLDWDRTYYVGVAAGRHVGRLGDTFPLFRDTVLHSLSQGIELVAIQHHGLQSNGEIGATYTLRTPDASLGPVYANVAAGTGLSYALGTPNYEDGPVDNPGRRYRLQFLATFETEWKLRALDHWSLVAQIHHRCGVYGLIAPRNVGSNFLAAGLRHQF
jgi:hypothetical protein